MLLVLPDLLRELPAHQCGDMSWLQLDTSHQRVFLVHNCEQTASHCIEEMRLNEGHLVRLFWVQSHSIPVNIGGLLEASGSCEFAGRCRRTHSHVPAAHRLQLATMPQLKVETVHMATAGSSQSKTQLLF